jgi:hypothetical protein
MKSTNYEPLHCVVFSNLLLLITLSFAEISLQHPNLDSPVAETLTAEGRLPEPQMGHELRDVTGMYFPFCIYRASASPQSSARHTKITRPAED